MNVRISQIATSLPKNSYDNNYFASYLETNDEWITSRTGIKSRYFCGDDESSTTLALDAISKLENIDDADAIVVATMSSTETCPSISSQLVNVIPNKENIFTVDINVGCTGFIHAFVTAASYIESNLFNKVILVCTEQMSKITDLNDRSTAILFGDGCGALVLEKSKNQTINNIITKTRSNNVDLKTVNNKLQMNGQNVFKFAVREVSKLIDELECKDEINYALLHQANIRILDGVSKRTNIDINKFINTVHKYGNTSAASIILCLNEIYDKIKNDDKILFCGFGAGLAWGGFVYKHSEE